MILLSSSYKIHPEKSACPHFSLPQNNNYKFSMTEYKRGFDKIIIMICQSWTQKQNFNLCSTLANHNTDHITVRRKSFSAQAFLLVHNGDPRFVMVVNLQKSVSCLVCRHNFNYMPNSQPPILNHKGKNFFARLLSTFQLQDFRFFLCIHYILLKNLTGVPFCYWYAIFLNSFVLVITH